MAYAVDGANIGEFDSHRCLRRLNVHACEEKYIERRKKSTLNAGVRRRGLSAARISSMYGRFGGLTGDISLTYGRHMRRKPQKRTPEVAVFAGDVPYISEMSQDKARNLPYVSGITKLKRSYDTFLCTRHPSASVIRPPGGTFHMHRENTARKHHTRSMTPVALR